MKMVGENEGGCGGEGEEGVVTWKTGPSRMPIRK